MKKIILFFLAITATTCYAQDTIRVMHYNLMYYYRTSTYCTTTNNPTATKDNCLKKIVKYVNPDIFTANEVNPVTATHQHVLDDILNTDGVTHYKRGAMSNNSGSDLSNAMFYNSDKLVLKSQNNIYTSVRDINIYNFYYKAWNIATTDTAYLTCIVVHLKAGSTVSDSTLRISQSNTIMNYLNTLNKKANYLLMGDFNTRTADEQCFQNFINHSNIDIRFYDPKNMIGDWYNNPTYSSLHTQSTHTSSEGCFSTGGMDDRFDFILQSEFIKNGTDHIHYINGSYQAIGNDGNHRNYAINYGTNNSAPSEIIDALYDMSDHLPVVMDLNVDQNAVGIGQSLADNTEFSFTNPVTDILRLSLLTAPGSHIEISISNLPGQTVFYREYSTSGINTSYEIPVNFLSKGFYLLKVADGRNRPVVKKFVKN
ncbi:MAG TPA: T9SS type A sorting domain-containing protein [Bacteroidales bacterium]|nr:T9SS type A sorting domain-containing protein [Bacteroidales bacterium]HQI69469.1 T9SS type A sorting domain-containing protein [Bacteroidales bacterium]